MKVFHRTKEGATSDQQVARWVTKWILPLRPQLQIFFPIFGMDLLHWTVAIATITSADGAFDLQHYCPIRGEIPRRALTLITKLMAAATGRRLRTPLKASRILGPKQFNLHDCGVFVAMFVSAMCFGETFTCNSQATVDRYRRHMSEVLNKGY